METLAFTVWCLGQGRLLTLHVVILEHFADVESGHAQQQVGLQRLVTPYAEDQLTEGRDNPARETPRQTTSSMTVHYVTHSVLPCRAASQEWLSKKNGR